jgi:tetratricopeptide (TPR) repeat protein
MAGRLAAAGEAQLAGMVLERLLDRLPDDLDALSRYGFVSYSLGNLEQAKRANERVLALDPGNVYATKGLGVVLHAMGRAEEGIDCLLRAVAMADPSDMDSYHDLAVVYLRSGRKDDARDLLEQAGRLSPGFRRANAALYRAAR